MTDDDMIESIRQKITDDRTHDNLEYYGLTTDARLTKGTSQISVLAGNGDAVSFTTSVNYAYVENIQSDYSLVLCPTSHKIKKMQTLCN